MKNNDAIKLLSQNMKEIRKREELTQEELSFRSGLHRNYISDTERGTRNVSVQALEKIAEGLGVTISDLFEIKKETK